MINLVPFYTIVSGLATFGGFMAAVTGLIGTFAEPAIWQWRTVFLSGICIALFFGFLAATLIAVGQPT